MKLKLLLLSLAAGLLSSSCVPLLVAAGAGAGAGYYVGKHYDVKVRNPIEVKKEND